MIAVMIVKAQVSLNDGGQSVLLYNEDRSFFKQVPSTQEFLRIMGGRPKAFFRVVVDNGNVHIKEEVDGWE